MTFPGEQGKSGEKRHGMRQELWDRLKPEQQASLARLYFQIDPLGGYAEAYRELVEGKEASITLFREEGASDNPAEPKK